MIINKNQYICENLLVDVIPLERVDSYVYLALTSMMNATTLLRQARVEKTRTAFIELKKSLQATTYS